MTVFVIQPILAIAAGVLILLAPRLLNTVVAVFLIVFGLLGIYPHLLG